MCLGRNLAPLETGCLDRNLGGLLENLMFLGRSLYFDLVGFLVVLLCLDCLDS